MRILVQNYSSETSTEPLYLDKAFKDSGIESYLWNNDKSAFDVFDEVYPDIFITHFGMLSEDIVKRLSGDDVKVIINMTGANEEILNQLKDLPINIALAFQNQETSLGLPVISPCADIFIGIRNVESPEYNIESLFLVSGVEDIDSLKSLIDQSETYHIVSTSNKLNDLKEVDVSLPLMILASIYPKYSSVVVTHPFQTMYDAAYYNGECELLVENSKSNVKLKKEVVESLHTPYNRAEQLLQAVGEVDLSKKVKVG